VKGSSRQFNQVVPDQGEKWLTGPERGGGTVGITRTTAELCRWTLSYDLCAHIAALARKMFHVANDDQIAFNESNPSRKLRDNSDEKKVVALLPQANVFNANNRATIPERLQNIVTKDVAMTWIEESLLKAHSLGQGELISFVKERLVMPREDGHHKKLRNPLPRSKAPTSTLYEVKRTIL